MTEFNEFLIEAEKFNKLMFLILIFFDYYSTSYIFSNNFYKKE